MYAGSDDAAWNNTQQNSERKMAVETRNLTLSPADSLVLSALFDPEASLRKDSENVRILPNDRKVSSNKASSDHQEDNQDAAQKIQLAIRLVNDEAPPQDSIRAAIRILDDVISASSTSLAQNSTSSHHEQDAEIEATARVNRAQARRLVIPNFPDDLAQGQLSLLEQDQLDAILQDLSIAIRILTQFASDQGHVRENVARSLAAAYTHRGYILTTLARTCRNWQTVRCLAASTEEELEEAGSSDFGQGGRFGNETAKKLSVLSNPYAKLCGGIVKEAMRREVETFFSSQNQ